MNPPITLVVCYENGEEIKRINLGAEKDTNHD